jgi:hypothetical protein
MVFLKPCCAQAPVVASGLTVPVSVIANSLGARDFRQSCRSRPSLLRNAAVVQTATTVLRRPYTACSAQHFRFWLALPSSETAYEDGLTVSYPYFTERQFQVSLDLLSKSLGQPVELSYQRIVDHSIIEEIARTGGL